VRLVTAIKTSYLTNGKPDIDAYDAHVVNQVEHGVEGVIVGGTTGEGQLMSWDEHIMVIALLGEPFVSLATLEAIRRERRFMPRRKASIVGHGCSPANPYYGKTSSQGLLEHFELCLQEGPAILYNVPGRTGQDIPDDVFLALKDHPSFLGIKECTGNIITASHQQHGIKRWSGNVDEAHDARHIHGSFGVVSVTSNLIPSLSSQMLNELSEQLNQDLQELIAWLFCQPNPIPSTLRWPCAASVSLSSGCPTCS
jgi:4-hydroxy-tetrahydrodipicolinate synthase